MKKKTLVGIFGVNPLADIWTADLQEKKNELATASNQ
jgi:hypothetical protein